MDHCETHSYYFDDDGVCPNSALPLVIFRQCLQHDEDVVRARLESNNWGGTWVNGIHDYLHYHSTAHETLVILQGTATVEFGGDKGKNLDVGKGDVLVIPAGVGHKKLLGSPAFKVMGAYPDGQQWDLRKGESGDRPEVLDAIKNVPLPSRDPINGDGGSLMGLWRK